MRIAILGAGGVGGYFGARLAADGNDVTFIARGAQRVNAKSIMGVMMLAAGQGVTVKVDAEGAEADQALQDIRLLFDNKFGEQE